MLLARVLAQWFGRSHLGHDGLVNVQVATENEQARGRTAVRGSDAVEGEIVVLRHGASEGVDEGFTKLLFDDSPEAGSGDGHAGRGHGKILGGGMVGTHAGDMIGEIALAIEMGADAVDIGKTIHPHPTLGESIGMAAEVAHGSCTDVPPARK